MDELHELGSVGVPRAGADLFFMPDTGLVHGSLVEFGHGRRGRARHILHARHIAVLGLFMGSALTSSSRPTVVAHACYRVRLGEEGLDPLGEASDWSRMTPLRIPSPAPDSPEYTCQGSRESSFSGDEGCPPCELGGGDALHVSARGVIPGTLEEGVTSHGLGELLPIPLSG
ncbi:hypothetical protein Dimus_033206 [Dionaea muscipula]